MENENVIGEGFENNQQPRRMLTRTTKRNIFYYGMMAWFILHVLVFYVYINLSMFTLAFEEYYEEGGRLLSRFAGIKNFQKIFGILASEEGWQMIKVSALMFCFHLGVGTVLALMLSYYVYKKLFLGEFFRVVLFLPSIISAVVMITLYRYMVNDMYIYISKEWFDKEVIGLLMGEMDTRMLAIIIYNLWMGYGRDVLLYTGAMSGINESIVEASELDGCTAMQEFWHITLPCIFPTLITFIIGGFANFFTNTLNIYTFAGKTSDIKSVGYYIYVKNLNSASVGYLVDKSDKNLCYSELSALGLTVTFITLPVVLTVRYLLTKFGPRVD